MRKIKNKNMMVLVVIFVVTLTSSIGYSALQSNLKVTADLNVLKDYIPDETLYGMMHHISEMDNTSSKYVSSPSGVDFHKGSSNTNGKGVYELNITASDKFPIYYYRGEVDNNVIFANFCWKIIRTTETGGVKLIYNGEPSDDGKCDNTGIATQIGTSPYNSSNSQAQYVGYKYDNDTKDSTVKKEVDSWYEENIENKSDNSRASYSTYLDDSFFCNDRSVAKTSGSYIYYGAYDRNLTNRTPSLECNDEDKFTVSSGKLKYPVGLITMDEAVYAGGEYSDTSSGYYLKTGYSYWTMSPSFFNGCALMWNVNSSNGFGDDLVTGTSHSVRPVLSLKHETKYLSGNGTKETPFLITPITRSLYNIIKTNSVLDNTKSKYVESETGIDFSKISSDANGKGIYELHTTVNDKYPIYYYRGAVTDNNIIFANFCWKIIRTTETGGVKIIYNGKPSSDNKCNNTGTATQIGEYAYNESFNEAKYVGYIYDDDTKDSTIKIEVDNWYEENIENKKDSKGASYSTYLDDNFFCNDRSVEIKSGGNIDYGPRYRNYTNRVPSLECSQDDDKFTVANEKLKYPVGLITLDEAAYAGGVYNESSENYLKTGSRYWTMSPSHFYGNIDNAGAGAWTIRADGDFYGYSVYYTNFGVRPVVNLLPSTQVTGAGNSNNPYVVIE